MAGEAFSGPADIARATGRPTIGNVKRDTDSRTPWLALIITFLGIFGIAVALTAFFSDLPLPHAGGTCGPSTGSETAIEALVEPGSIGAGSEPSTSNTAGRANWLEFVHDCQSATDERAFIAIPTLIVSIGIATLGLILLRRRARRTVDPVPDAMDHQWWLGPPYAFYGGAPQAVGVRSAVSELGGTTRTLDAPAAPPPPPPPPPPPNLQPPNW